jgi:hypothetical protein
MAAGNDDKTSNSSDSDKGKDNEARTCRSFRTSATVTTGTMAMTLEAMVANVVSMAIGQQGTEEIGRRKSLNNQHKLNINNAVYNNNEQNDNAMYHKDVASGIVIGQTPM